MKILLWRGWSPAFEKGVLYSRLGDEGFGGTEMQMLWHAQHLAEEKHKVQVLGATLFDAFERAVDFVGCRNRSEQQTAIKSGRVSPPDVIFLEGGFDAARFFREAFPSARLVHIGQNIDSHADKAAFARAREIDLFAFVGKGHFADYCARFPALRHKFCLVRNALPWAEFHGRLAPAPPEDKVVWVGGWSKKGLRTWFEAMHRQLQERPSLTWVLCGPVYSSSAAQLPPHLHAGLSLPEDRVIVKSVPLMGVLRELASARAVLVSLGNETGAISALDGHAMAKPVLSGNDMVYKFANPDGTGLRVSNTQQADEALTYLLDHPETGDALGKRGRRFVYDEYHERMQRDDLVQLLDLLQSDPAVLQMNKGGTSKWQERVHDWIDKAGRKVRMLCR